MIIFGTIVLTGALIASGVFWCPQCGDDRSYQHHHLRRFFTIFFIPLIPLSNVGQVVTCMTCREKFDPVVLARPTNAVLMRTVVAGLRAAIAVMLRAGEVSDRAILLALRAVESAGVRSFTQDDLRQDLAHPEHDAAIHLRAAGGLLGADGVEPFLMTVLDVGGADGTFTRARAEAAVFIADNLGISRAHTRGILEAFLKQ